MPTSRDFALSPQQIHMLDRVGSALGPMGYGFRVKAALHEAVNAICASPKRPDLATLVSNFERYAAYAAHPSPRDALNHYMVAIREIFALREIAPDALALYLLQVEIAEKTKIL